MVDDKRWRERVSAAECAALDAKSSAVAGRGLGLALRLITRHSINTNRPVEITREPLI